MPATFTYMVNEPSERDNKTAVFEATQEACKKTLQSIVDDIENFNEKCPNHTVKASDISPALQCRDVSDNGQIATAVQDYGDRGVGCFDTNSTF